MFPCEPINNIANDELIQNGQKAIVDSDLSIALIKSSPNWFVDEANFLIPNDITCELAIPDSIVAQTNRTHRESVNFIVA